MEWNEVQATGRWMKSYKACEGDLSIAVNLRKFEYENGIQMWDVLMVDKKTNIGRTIIIRDRGDMNIDMEKTCTEAVRLMREHLLGKVEYHHANYEKWQSRADRFEGMTA